MVECTYVEADKVRETVGADVEMAKLSIVESVESAVASPRD